MPIPIGKVFVSAMRTLAWPFMSVVSRRVKANTNSRWANFYYRFGLKCFQFEAMIDYTIVQNNLTLYAKDEDGRNRKVQVDTKKIGKEAAISKGVDYLIDLSIFYCGFIALSLFWLHERTRDFNILIGRIEAQEAIN